MSISSGIVHPWPNPAFRSSPHLLPVSQPATGLILSRPICCKPNVLKSVANTDTVVATDDNYGHKEVISVNPRLYDYLLANVREPEILRELREETATMSGSQMQVSPDQAQLLAMLVQILGAERCIEVGVYTGYSSLAVALVLPERGQLVACERDAKSLEVAQRYYTRAGISNKVKVKHGLAADTLKSMIENGEGSSYDFAFVDAEKKMYQDYFELLLQLVRVGGVIVIDNVLWHGRVADPLVNDAKTLSIRNFNRKLMVDDRVSISMPIPAHLPELCPFLAFALINSHLQLHRHNHTHALLPDLWFHSSVPASILATLFPDRV
ncbi:probable caffeoyl-coa o-methyltransferase 2 [Phtheirospermum japonicum]|uniref:Probable caffeoyl-coa o-methyltransferase 2 n=1 Tax=Phtheirospermum japonicum TaxID=374723 RepID=A0A830D3E7_9LAMI|nr:probable caffeoyl-coa o-methyltransferase 2 [Phtheirospermum japonicum]